MHGSSSTNPDYETFDSSGIIDVLVSDFLARYRDGDRPTIEEYARRHPTISRDILRVFPLMLSVEKVKFDRQQSSDGSATLAGRVLTRVGDFSLIREIGRGGMGIVYEAEQESLGRRVAIKILPKQSLLDDQALDRFHREAKTAAAMHHSNIVPIFGTGESDGTHFLVMQLIRGEALDKRLIRDGQPFSFSEVARVGVQIADALAYAHENRVLHRDVKPANILIEESGVAQITDFGLASNADIDTTNSRTLSGSLRYMAPERFRGRTDHRSDLYSLGLTLYEMLARQPAFMETDPHRLIHSIGNTEPKALRLIQATLPLDLETIVLKAINPEPSQRYQSMSELRDDLQRFFSDEPILARRASSTERAWRWCRKNPKLAATTGFSLSMLVTTTIVSTASLLFTSQANRRTLSALKHSEETVNLALQSLDGVVNVVSTPLNPNSSHLIRNENSSPFEPFPPELSMMPSPSSAMVLERIQPLYERLSQQAPTRPDIILQMTDASFQLAYLQQQLGRSQDAMKTLQHSIDLLNDRGEATQLTESDKQVRLARLHNNLGEYASVELDFRKADKEFELAVTAATLGSPENEEALVELARAHLQIGDLPPQRRREEAASAVKLADAMLHLDTAKQLLEQLRSTEGKSPPESVETLYAKTYLALSRRATDYRVRRDYFAIAISELRAILERSPKNQLIRFELVQALSDVDVRRGAPPPRERKEATTRMWQALDELKPLRRMDSNASIYSIAELHIWHKLSSIAAINRSMEDAVEYIRNAIDIQSSLVDALPNKMSYRCWRALLLRSQAEIYRQQSDFISASKSIDAAMKDLDAVDPSLADQPFLRSTRQIITEFRDSFPAI